MCDELYRNSSFDYYYDDYEYTVSEPDLADLPITELLLPLTVYSVTFVIGLVGNVLILVAVRGQKQVGKCTQSVDLNNFDSTKRKSCDMPIILSQCLSVGQKAN